MHIQAKSTAAASPANLADFLDILAQDIPNEGPLNLEGITGCGAETGGGIVFTLHHDHFELGVDRLLPPTREGDVILVANTGAYGHAMSSHYNLREPAKEFVL